MWHIWHTFCHTVIHKCRVGLVCFYDEVILVVFYLKINRFSYWFAVDLMISTPPSWSIWQKVLITRNLVSDFCFKMLHQCGSKRAKIRTVRRTLLSHRKPISKLFAMPKCFWNDNCTNYLVNVVFHTLTSCSWVCIITQLFAVLEQCFHFLWLLGVTWR